MNIYMNPQNEERLQRHKAAGGSMSGLVNELLAIHFAGTDKKTINLDSIRATGGVDPGYKPYVWTPNAKDRTGANEPVYTPPEEIA